MSKETPAEVLHDIALHVQFVWCGGDKLSPGGPGAVIQRLPEERRAILRELKSSDIESIRPGASLY